MRALPPARLLAVVAPVSLCGVAAYLAAAFAFVTSSHSTTELAGIAALLAASTLAERFPVPVEGADAKGVSLGFVFAVAALVLFGWAAGTLVYATATTLVAVAERRPFVRALYNFAAFSIAGTIAGAALFWIDGRDVESVLFRVAVTWVVLYVVNVVLVSAAIAASGSDQ